MRLRRYFAKYRSSKLVIGFIIFVLFSSCNKPEEQIQNETILARIGDRTISVNEFIRRAEYTPRPVYCRGEDYVQRKIVLNSLIAEKLLALEAGADNELTRTPEYQLYVQGRKEQAMRQWQYHQEAYQRVQLDTSEIKAVYNLAGRTYKIAYYALKDSNIARLASQELQRGGKSFEQLHNETGTLEGIPQREVTWDSPEEEAIHQALFSSELQKGQILGPLSVRENSYVMMKILGWTDKVAVSDMQMRTRWNDVKENLTHKKAGKLYEQYAAGVMRGKTLEFSPATFRKMVEIVAPYYLKSSEEKQAALQQQFWGNENEENVLSQMGTGVDAILEEPLFRIDGQVWTVRDLEREIKVHPLVFRKKNLQQGEFAEQFKLAIVDMVRDRYLTQEAYKKGYDQAEAVQRNVSMWRDNLLFLYQQTQYLKSLGKQHNFSKDYLQIIETDLNPYLDSLQAKYHDVIEINTDVFEKIKLTAIDMLVLRRNDPFPVVVPSFPVITTDNRLDYGRKMN
ncbi:hypothetical protein HUU40_04575 [candidate division KSB1 bacterium]|nr:hypothetical protein [candidate division KSB1 bacterium]